VSSDKILVLLPCLNESAALGRTILRLQQEIPAARIVVIDNGSTDDSVQVAEGLKVQIVHEPRRGKGNAFRKGLNSIDEHDLAVLMIDSDDTYGLENLKLALDSITYRGYDMVVGSRKRVISESSLLEKPFRIGHILGNKVLSAIGQFLHPAGIEDTLSGWRVFSPRFLNSFPGGSSGFEVEAELNAHAYLMNSPVLNVEVSYRGRAKGSNSKLNTYRDGFRILKTSLRFFRNDRPQLAFTLFSIPWLIGSGYFTYRAVIGYLRSGLVAQFPSLIAGTCAFVVSSLLFATGMILERIKQVRVINAKYAYRNFGAK
jgi:glycosyltransferase involved in cell wall biosynthesis